MLRMYNKAYQPYYRRKWSRRSSKTAPMTILNPESAGHDLASLLTRVHDNDEKEDPVSSSSSGLCKCEVHLPKVSRCV
jgi:hypothetical protein